MKEFNEYGEPIETPKKKKFNLFSGYTRDGKEIKKEVTVENGKSVKFSFNSKLDLEYNDIIQLINENNLDVQVLGRGFAWLDTGTMDSLADASDFVRVIQKRQGVEISAPEEIAYKNGWITKEELLESAAKYGKSTYGQNLKIVAERRIKD